MQPISRRVALQLGGLGLASAVAGGIGLTRQAAAGFTPASPSALVEPVTVASVDGVLQIRLEASEGPVRIAGHEATALRFNGSVPGPTLRLQPGDRLRIHLANRLDRATNLHVHGLHVSPEGNGDNAFVTVSAGADFDYDYQLPPDHPSGVFWYHPHLHGSVADQIFGGLYGAIIVGDQNRSSDLVVTTRDRVLVISDISLDAAGNVRPATASDRMAGREGELVLVDGQARPVLAAQPGERERWRVINACVARYLQLRLDGQHVQVLGIDSGRLGSPRDVEDVVLAPGNRADLLVTTVRGTSELQASPYDRGDMMSMGGGMAGNERARNAGRLTLATLQVTGDQVPSLPPVPAQPHPRDLRGTALDGQRALTLGMGMSMGGNGGMRFTIDGNTFDHNRVDQTARIGTVEEWTITNTSPMDHPMHLHVWPMQLIEQAGQSITLPTWQDVVNVPAHGTVKVRIAFDDFAGRAVYHCHILDHEDQGMMGVINVRA